MNPYEFPISSRPNGVCSIQLLSKWSVGWAVRESRHVFGSRRKGKAAAAAPPPPLVFRLLVFPLSIYFFTIVGSCMKPFLQFLQNYSYRVFVISTWPPVIYSVAWHQCFEAPQTLVVTLKTFPKKKKMPLEFDYAREEYVRCKKRVWVSGDWRKWTWNICDTCLIFAVAFKVYRFRKS